MEHHKKSKLLNNSTVSKFVTKNGLKCTIYQTINIFANKNIRFKTLVVRSDLYDYIDIYMLL